MLDPDNKVVKARVKIANPGNKLKPEMFANVTIKAKSGESLPVINTRALIFDNDKNYYHDHLTGEYRGAACGVCNRKMILSRRSLPPIDR